MPLLRQTVMLMANPRVLVIGSYNHDHVWTSEALPAPGATRLGTYANGPGGKGFNQAVACARTGAETIFLTALGNDAAAGHARALATGEGIDLRDEVHARLPSGSAGIFVDASGRNVIVVAPGANAALSPEFVSAQADAFASAGVLLAQLEVAPDAVLRALQLARNRSATTVLNPAPANAATTDELLAAADILTPNETEFVALLQRHHGLEMEADSVAHWSDVELHDLCRRLGAATCVITLGEHGVFVSHPDTAYRGDPMPFYRVDPEPVEAVDTTGAGDAFSGALAAALALRPGAAFIDAARYANRYAALSTERHGAALAMPRASDLGRFDSD